MKLCPHCGTELRDNARFCTACMTPLNEKRVIPHTRYVSLRWLPIAAAVLALVVAVQWLPQALRLPVQSDSSISNGAAISTSASTSPTGDDNPTVPEVTGSTADAPGTTLGGRPGNIHIYQPGADGDTTTEPYDWDVGKGTTHNIGTTSRTTSKKDTSTTTTSKTTTTTTTTKKTPTTTTTTRPYWLDATPAAFTEDGLPIEEVRWTYEPITSTSLWFSRCDSVDYPNIVEVATSRNATPSGVPLNRCIRVTGCSDITSNGIYRVPAMIDGKVVAAVDFGDTFADKVEALAVKRIYLPPDAIALYGGIENCTNLEGLYITGKDFWFKPDTLPDCGYYYWGGVKTYNLEIFTAQGFTPIYVASFSMGLDHVVYYAFQGKVYDAQKNSLTAAQCQTLYGGGGT